MMHILTNSVWALSVLLVLHLTGEVRKGTGVAERYCNEEYAYCVRYPGSLFPYKQLLPDSSGIGLQPYDRSALVTVRGDRQAAGKSPQTYFGEQLQALAPLQDRMTILDTLYGDDYYEAYFTWQTESIFHQAFFFDEYCVVMIARVPTDRPMLLKQIRREVQLEFEDR